MKVKVKRYNFILEYFSLPFLKNQFNIFIGIWNWIEDVYKSYNSVDSTHRWYLTRPNIIDSWQFTDISFLRWNKK